MTLDEKKELAAMIKTPIGKDFADILTMWRAEHLAQNVLELSGYLPGYWENKWQAKVAVAILSDMKYLYQKVSGGLGEFISCLEVTANVKPAKLSGKSRCYITLSCKVLEPQPDRDLAEIRVKVSPALGRV